MTSLSSLQQQDGSALCDAEKEKNKTASTTTTTTTTTESSGTTGASAFRNSRAILENDAAFLRKSRTGSNGSTTGAPAFRNSSVAFRNSRALLEKDPAFLRKSRTGSNGSTTGAPAFRNSSVAFRNSIALLENDAAFIRKSRAIPEKDRVQILLPKASTTANVSQKMSQFSAEKLIQSQRRLGKLYGRSEELKLLQQELESLVLVKGDKKENNKEEEEERKQYRSLVEISGLSGEGKTALALQLKEAAQRKGCFFILGKFDLANKGEPFSGIKTAISQLIREKILEGLSPKKLELLREDIRTKMDWEIDLLCPLIPELAELVQKKTKTTTTIQQTPSGDSSTDVDAPSFLTSIRSLGSGRSLLGSGRSLVGSDRQLKLAKMKSEKLFSFRRISAATTQGNNKNLGVAPEGNNNGTGVGFNNAATSGVGAAGADRLQFALRKLFNVVTSFAPLIMVCDDVQWADNASIKLLKGLITDEGNPSLIIIWTYRKNMVGKDHAVTTTLEDIRNAQEERNISMLKINIGELKEGAVNELISDTLDVSPSQTEELTKILYHKTLGNVFFVRSYLQSLAQKGLLRYQLVTLSWEWDLPSIREGCSATETVVDLMKEKLQHSPGARRLLPLAACMGATFDTRLLQEVLRGIKSAKEQDILEIFHHSLGTNDLNDLSMEDEIGLLEQIEMDGLIEVVSATKFTFIHDKVQEASLALVGSDHLDDLRFGIGYLLLQQNLEASLAEEALFLIVNLLNSRLEKIPDSQQLVVCELNLIAGDKALLAAAYLPSAAYYRAAIKLLPEGHWQLLYGMSLHLYLSAAESEMCLGGYDEMNAYLGEVLNLDCPMLDKLPAYSILVDAFMAKSELMETFSTNRGVLQQLGFRFPLNHTSMRTTVAVAKMKLRTKKWKPDALIELPICDDPVHEAIDQMLTKFLLAVMMVRPESYVLAIILACRHVLDNGLTTYSASSLAWLGLVIVTVHQDYQWAKEHMEFTQSLLQRLPNDRIEARVGGLISLVFVAHWSAPIHNSIKPLIASYSRGMETCDLDSAFWCAHFYHEASLYAGKSLALLQKDAETYCKQEDDYGMIKHAECLKSVWQLILNLRGLSDNTIVLTGTAHDEAAALAAIEETKDYHHLGHVQKDRLFAMAIFGEFQQGADLGREAIEVICKALAGQHSTLVARFVTGLCCFEMAYTSKMKKYKQAAYQNLKIVKLWFNKGNPNAHAEKAAYEGKPNKALSLYEQTIILSGKSGYKHDCALASERLATYYLRLGDKVSAKTRLQDALMLYEEWGATKKVELLRAKTELV